MNDLWLRISVLIIGVVVIGLYYWLVVRPHNHSDAIRMPGFFTKKPRIPTFPDAEEIASNDVTITRRIPVEEAEQIRAHHADAESKAKVETVSETIQELSESAPTDITVEDNAPPEVPNDQGNQDDQIPHNESNAVVKATTNDEMSAASVSTLQDQAAEMQADDQAVTRDCPESKAVSGGEKTVHEVESQANYHAGDAMKSEDQLKTTAESGARADMADESESKAAIEYDADSDVSHFAAMIEANEGLAQPERTDADDDPDTHINHNTNPISSTTLDSLAVAQATNSAHEQPPIKARHYQKRGGGLLGLFRRRRPAKPEPVSTAPSEVDATTQGKLSYTPSTPSQERLAARPPRKMVLVALYPQQENRLFVGRDIKNVMNTFSLVLSSKTGYYESLSALSAPGEIETVFSVGHLRGDSRFNRTTINTMETTGLVFFMNIPGPVNAADAVDMMFSIAAKSAKMLDAKVCDQNTRKLTVDQMINIRDEAVSFQQALIDRNLL